ncbi:MAG: hypothetical protein H6747_15230 [Deltaproteobacteria bacterium]|nr:hypothetical protein [Deltaproteobacteria bacterium]
MATPGSHPRPKSKWPGIFTKSLGTCWPPTLTQGYPEDWYTIDDDGNRVWQWIWLKPPDEYVNSLFVVEDGIPGTIQAFELTGPGDLHITIDVRDCSKGTIVANEAPLKVKCPVAAGGSVTVDFDVGCTTPPCVGDYLLRYVVVSDCGSLQYLDNIVPIKK